MGKEVTNPDNVDNPTIAPADLSKAVVDFANSTAWRIETAMGMADGMDIADLIRRYRVGLVRLDQAEPKGRSLADPKKPGALTAKLGDELAAMAIKINPTIANTKESCHSNRICLQAFREVLIVLVVVVTVIEVIRPLRPSIQKVGGFTEFLALRHDCITRITERSYEALLLAEIWSRWASNPAFSASA